MALKALLLRKKIELQEAELEKLEDASLLKDIAHVVGKAI